MCTCHPSQEESITCEERGPPPSEKELEDPPNDCCQRCVQTYVGKTCQRGMDFFTFASKDPWLPKKCYFVHRFLEDVIEITKCEIYTYLDI